MADQAKSTVVQVRLTKRDRERVERVAKAHYLDTSAWIRMTILRAIDVYESAEGEG